MLRIVRYLSKAEIGQMLVALVSIVGQIWLDLTLPDYMSDITQLVETPGSEMRDIWVAGGKMLLVSLGSAAISPHAWAPHSASDCARSNSTRWKASDRRK